MLDIFTELFDQKGVLENIVAGSGSPGTFLPSSRFVTYMVEEVSSVNLSELNIAVAHWHIRSWGGAEYLISQLAEALGCETVYTLGAPSPDESNPYGDVDFEDVTPSLSYSWIRGAQRTFGRIFEYAQWEDVDWRDFGDPDVLITSGATTRAVITPDDTLHVNYCHSPPRWFYDLYHDRKNSVAGVLGRPLIRHLRIRDQTVDSRVDYYFVNSPIVTRRLWKYHKRDSEVLYPPVDWNAYHTANDDGYYLHLGRLDKEKGVPAIVEAFTGTEHRLIMAGARGDVSDSVIQTINAAKNIEWRGFVTKNEKIDLLSRCRAVVFNGRNEDFGIIPIEAIASGKPVLVRAEGFPCVLVQEFGYGLIHDGTGSGIHNAIDQFERGHFDGIDRQELAELFDYGHFKRKLTNLIMDFYDSFSTLEVCDWKPNQ